VWRKDGQTSCHCIVHAMHTHRVVKMYCCLRGAVRWCSRRPLFLHLCSVVELTHKTGPLCHKLISSSSARSEYRHGTSSAGLKPYRHFFVMTAIPVNSFVASKCIFWAQNITCICGRGSALDPNGGAYSTPPNLLAGRGGEGRKGGMEGEGNGEERGRGG